MKIKRFLGIGYCAADILLHIDGKVKLNRKIQANLLEFQGGGPVANATSALAIWGIKSYFAGSIGDDIGGKFIKNSLKKCGVNTSLLKISKGFISPLSVCISHDGNLRTIFYNKGNAPQLQISDIESKFPENISALEIDGHQPDVQLWVSNRLIQRKIPVILDAGSMREEIVPLLKVANHIITSKDFADSFEPSGDYEKACKKLFFNNTEAVVITLGEKGSIGYDGKKFIAKKALKVKVIDTVGAGDIYHAGYIYALLKGWNLEKRMEFATVCAGLKCRKIGGRLAIPSKEEIFDIFQKEKVE